MLDRNSNVMLYHKSCKCVTVYQNNSSLLKRQGDAVRAGEPIAYVGPADKHHSMPYLHFEIWINGKAVKPEEYISF